MSTYHERVQKMCDRFGIQNPIREEDLRVSAVSFLTDVEKEEIECIEGTDMNRAGRLFFQDFVGRHYPAGKDGVFVESVSFLPRVTGSNILHEALEHFGEIWHDAEVQGRAMLAALKKSHSVTVHWKP